MDGNNEIAVRNSNEQKFEANKVSVKIPPFWEEKPEIWFFQVEAQFSIANINQEKTKFNYLVAQLDPKFIENIWDIIQSNEKNKYSCAKSRLLSTFKESEEKSIKKMLTGISLGDMKPSLLLKKMKSLAGEEDKCKTAIITPFGLYELNVMSFGLKNAPATFQRFVHEVFRGLDFSFPYLDDILIASTNEMQHEDNLKIVFERLNTYGLKINISKSVFGVEEIEFLGYLISKEGSKSLPEKVKAITNYKKPETLLDLRIFLGMINFYRRYLKDAAKNQALLHDNLKGAKKKKKETREKYSGQKKPKNSSKIVKMT
ncbi:hypothetical protein TNCT_669521 [Trichonephila clavata]|uniref:Reverse transcriptase domain-containing protein n=1 Tax=Trichonephila clavata TaxID=2740835 RepID=A0A8X6GI38_TRICU|nr:hypothetical protein TNCT_669521 [Trichonephila clavata]